MTPFERHWLTLNDVAELLSPMRVTFDDGSQPARNQSEVNARRYVSENDDYSVVRGWLIIGTCIFTKHWALRNAAGACFEITPNADRLPFAAHVATIGRYDDLPNEINLLIGLSPADGRSEA